MKNRLALWFAGLSLLLVSGVVFACVQGTCIGNPAPMNVTAVSGCPGTYLAVVPGPSGGGSTDLKLNGTTVKHDTSGVSPVVYVYTGVTSGQRVFAAIANYADGDHRYYETTVMVP